MQKFTKIAAFLALSVAAAAPAMAAPETYVADSTHTFSRFSYSHFGYSTQVSRFNKNSGKVVFDKAAKTSSVDIVIDTKPVDTGYATFKSTKVIFEGDKPAKVEGNLTINGVTKPVTLTVTSFQAMPHPMLKKDAIGANAYTVIKRSEFNAGKYATHVGDEVRIDVAIEAIKE